MEHNFATTRSIAETQNALSASAEFSRLEKTILLAVEQRLNEVDPDKSQFLTKLGVLPRNLGISDIFDTRENSLLDYTLNKRLAGAKKVDLPQCHFFAGLAERLSEYRAPLQELDETHQIIANTTYKYQQGLYEEVRVFVDNFANINSTEIDDPVVQKLFSAMMKDYAKLTQEKGFNRISFLEIERFHRDIRVLSQSVYFGTRLNQARSSEGRTLGEIIDANDQAAARISRELPLFTEAVNNPAIRKIAAAAGIDYKVILQEISQNIQKAGDNDIANFSYEALRRITSLLELVTISSPGELDKQVDAFIKQNSGLLKEAVSEEVRKPISARAIRIRVLNLLS